MNILTLKIISIILLILRSVIFITMQFIFINRKFPVPKKNIFALIAITIFSTEIFAYFMNANTIYTLPRMVSYGFTFYVIAPASIINYKITKDDKYIMNYYSQSDKRWARIKYGASTIGASGCVPVTMAIVHSSIDENITPIHTTEWELTNTNYVKNNSTDIEFLIQYGKAHNFTCGYIYRNDIDVILKMLQDGYFIFALIPPKLRRLNKILGFAQAHQICIYDYDTDNDKIKIVDPENISTVHNPISVTKLKRWVNNLPENINAPFVYMKYIA